MPLQKLLQANGGMNGSRCFRGCFWFGERRCSGLQAEAQQQKTGTMNRRRFGLSRCCFSWKISSVQTAPSRPQICFSGTALWWNHGMISSGLEFSKEENHILGTVKRLSWSLRSRTTTWEILFLLLPVFDQNRTSDKPASALRECLNVLGYFLGSVFKDCFMARYILSGLSPKSF